MFPKNTLRKQKWVNFFSPINDHEDLESSDKIEEAYERKEREQLILKLISALPYKSREVIILKYYNDFSQEQIADILNIPIGTVKSRINSSLKKIRKEIDKTMVFGEVFIHE